MHRSRLRIVDNVRFLFIGQIVSWVLGLIWVIYLPRYLGAENMGRYAIAMAIWAVLTGIISSGVPTYLTKEIARSPEKAATYLGTALLQRYVIFLLCCIPVALYSHLMGYPAEVTTLIWIVACGVPFAHTGLIFSAVFQGLEIMQYVALVEILAKVFLVGGSLILMAMRFGVNEIAMLAAASGLLGVVVQLALLRQRIPIRLTWSNALSREMLIKSVPYALSSLVLMLYGETDKLIMSALVEERVVGWYGVAATLAMTFMVVPNVFATAIFPALSRDSGQKGDEAARVLRKSLDLVLIAGVPIGFGLMTVSDQVVHLLYASKFPESAPVLRILGATLALTFVATILGRYLLATGRANQWTLAMFVCVVLAFPLSLALVPWAHNSFGNGAIGSALRFACTEAIMVLVGIYLLPRGLLTRANARTALRVLAAGGVMVGTCWFVRDFFIAVPVAVGVATYAAMILVLRVLQPEDIRLFRESWQGALASVGLRSGGRGGAGPNGTP